MGIDQHWLSDAELDRLSRQTPSTTWGVSLMRDAWPRVYTHLLSSETYRGCTAALSHLRAEVNSQTPILEIMRAIEDADRALGASTAFPMGSDGASGAALVLANAWQRSQTGLTAAQLAAALESELIYVAQLFMQARQYEAQNVIAP